MCATYDATLRNLELIGEAATRVPSDVREAHPHFPWRRIIGTRNRLAHDYLGIDDDMIWDIVRTEIPNLLTALRSCDALASQSFRIGGFSVTSLFSVYGFTRSAI